MGKSPVTHVPLMGTNLLIVQQCQAPSNVVKLMHKSFMR